MVLDSQEEFSKAFWGSPGVGGVSGNRFASVPLLGSAIALGSSAQCQCCCSDGFQGPASGTLGQLHSL